MKKENLMILKNSIIILIISLLLLGIVFYCHNKNRIQISENPNFIFGAVKKTYYVIKTGNHVLCEYIVSGKKYIATSTYNPKIQYIKNGDSLQIAYSSKDPDNSFIVEDKQHRLKTKAYLYPNHNSLKFQDDFKLIRDSLNSLGPTKNN